MLFQLFHSEPLGAGATYAVSTQPPNPSTQIQIGIPNAPAGDYFLLFGVDRSNESWSDDKIRETNETNNVFAVPIEVTAPAVDLQISAPSAPADAIAGGAIEWLGPSPTRAPILPTVSRASGSKARFGRMAFICRTTINLIRRTMSCSLRAEATHRSAQAGLYRATATVTLRSNAVGSKYLFIVADTWNRQSETNETNNVSVAMPIQITPPAVDLVMSIARRQPTPFKAPPLIWLGPSPTPGKTRRKPVPCGAIPSFSRMTTCTASRRIGCCRNGGTLGL